MLISADPLAHAGLTVAAAFVFEQAFMRGRPFPFLGRRGKVGPVGAGESGEFPVKRGMSRFIDYRLVIIGSLLPDLIDRPLGLWVLPDMIRPSGRGFGHTLLFNALFILLALVMLRFKGSRGPLVLALACAGHLLIDLMWESPRTLFWPLYGIRFGAADASYTPDWLRWVRIRSVRMLIDGFGALVLAVFVGRLFWRRRFLRWLARGVT